MEKSSPCAWANQQGDATTRALERFREPWSVLILREAFNGAALFDQFQTNLGIGPSMLTRRLNMPVAEARWSGASTARTRRFEYILTERGRDFRPVLLSLMAWARAMSPNHPLPLNHARLRS